MLSLLIDLFSVFGVTGTDLFGLVTEASTATMVVNYGCIMILSLSNDSV